MKGCLFTCPVHEAADYAPGSGSDELLQERLTEIEICILACLVENEQELVERATSLQEATKTVRDGDESWVMEFPKEVTMALAKSSAAELTVAKQAVPELSWLPQSSVEKVVQLAKKAVEEEQNVYIWNSF